MRIGHGYDVHRFVAGDHVMLGGVKIAHDRAVEAHSDGDVLLHALCDALLGAAALGDIGRHFPDHAQQFKSIDSRILLRRTGELLAQHGYRLINADLTLIAQTPKVSGYTQAMCKNIAADLAVDVGAISVKATTTEKLGFVGEKKGIAAEAVVLIDDK